MSGIWANCARAKEFMQLINPTFFLQTLIECVLHLSSDCQFSMEEKLPALLGHHNKITDRRRDGSYDSVTLKNFLNRMQVNLDMLNCGKHLLINSFSKTVLSARGLKIRR